MPIQVSAFQLPSGARAVRADCTGTISHEEAEAWMSQGDPGGPFHGVPVLALTLQLDGVTPGARGVFARRRDLTDIDPWTAVVITNPIIRVATNFVMRVARTKRQRIFATEQEAVLWLDERIRQDASRAARP